MGNKSSTCLLLVVISPALGCSAQLATGWGTRSPDYAPRVISVEGKVEDMRKHGPTFGARGVITADNWERPLVLRNAMVNAGYQYRPRFPYPGVEAELELGLGEPNFVDYDGVGGYVGARLSALYRLYGDADTDPSAYYTITPLLDVVVTGYAGGWSAPVSTESRPVVGDLGGLIGLRFGIGTDVARSPIQEAKR